MSPALRLLAVPALLLLSLTAEAALRTLTPPAELFDLRPYRLGLPVDRDGRSRGEAATVSNAELVGPPGYQSDYFHLQSDGALVFHAPSNGATTSPGVGSDHTRSELRELYRGKDSTEWTNRIGGTLRADCLVRRTALRAATTVIGQIHGLDSMMMTLAFRPKTGRVSAVVLDAPHASGTREIVLAEGVSTGDRLRYTIQWIGRTLSITVNGHTENLSTSAAWDGVPVYFKAGAYSTAPASGNLPLDATEVWFYALQIQH